MANSEQLAKLREGVVAWNKWRLTKILVNPDLSGADLSGADLSGANLSFANLSRANLSFADLSGADLSFADLSRANLSGANLGGVESLFLYYISNFLDFKTMFLEFFELAFIYQNSINPNIFNER